MGSNAYGKLDPEDILGKPADITYAHTINQLVEEGLILRAPINESIAFRLNPQKKQIYDAELQPWYRSSLVQWGIGIAIVLVTAFLGIVN